MKINRKDKLVTFEPKDGNTWKVALIHPDFNEYIICKITYTDKGFGLQVFPELYYEDATKRPLNIIVGESGSQELFKERYAAIWKLTPKHTRQLRKKFK